MEICEGFEDWLACSRCPHLCTKMCPIEGENVIEEMKRKIRLMQGHSGYKSMLMSGYKSMLMKGKGEKE